MAVRRCTTTMETVGKSPSTTILEVDVASGRDIRTMDMVGQTNTTRLHSRPIRHLTRGTHLHLERLASEWECHRRLELPGLGWECHRRLRLPTITTADHEEAIMGATKAITTTAGIGRHRPALMAHTRTTAPHRTTTTGDSIGEVRDIGKHGRNPSTLTLSCNFGIPGVDIWDRLLRTPSTLFGRMGISTRAPQ